MTLQSIQKWFWRGILALLVASAAGNVYLSQCLVNAEAKMESAVRVSDNAVKWGEVQEHLAYDCEKLSKQMEDQEQEMYLQTLHCQNRMLDAAKIKVCKKILFPDHTR